MLYLGADHRGFSLKESLKKWLLEKNIPFEDLGNKILDPEDDFVDYAKVVAEKVAGEKDAKGVLICGSGVGMDMAANKVPGIRSGLVFNKDLAIHARSHEDINIVALPSDAISLKDAQDILEAFLNTSYLQQEKYQRRLNKVSALENK